MPCSRVDSSNASNRSEDELLQALEEAVAERLIETMPDSQDFRFGHALIRETLYDEILGVRRARLHQRIGELLERRHGDEDAGVWPQLAYHFSESGGGAAAAKALEYARRAGEQADRLLAFEESTRLHCMALQLLQRHFPGDLAQQCEVLLALGESQKWVGSAESASDWFRQAAEVARQCGVAALFARAAIGFAHSSAQASHSGEAAVDMLLEAIAMHPHRDTVRVELTARLCVAYVYCDRADEAMEAHRRAVSLARELGDPRGLYVALAAISAAIYWPEILPERLAAGREAWEIAERLDLRERIAHLLPFYMYDLAQVGAVELLARLSERGRQLATQWRTPYWLSACQHFAVLAAINEGRFEEAERWAVQAMQEARPVAEDKAIGAYGMQMFCLRREQGRLREVLPTLRHFVKTTPQAQTWKPGLALLYAELDMRIECRAEYERVPWQRVSGRLSDASRTTVVMLLAETCVYLEDSPRATLFYDMLRSRAGMILLGDSSGPCLGSADRLLGSLATLAGQWDVAQRHFEAALATEAATGWRVWQAHGRYRYAWMLERRDGAGDRTRAHRLAADALDDATALGMQALAPRVQALLEKLGMP
jgi:tetratricopeptide (TPR) repeat protein